MKKRTVVLILTAILSLFIWTACACAEESPGKPINKLPSSLEVIDAEAFAGTALTAVELPENTAEIGDYAFANNSQLEYIYFPVSLKYISNNAFEGSQKSMFFGSYRSYAYGWAGRNTGRFSVVPTIRARTEKTAAILNSDNETRCEKEEKKSSDTSVQQSKDRKQNGRTIGEMKATRGRRISSVYVQSRFFP
jgi:hypothetical protein